MKKTKVLAFLMAATMLASCSKAPEETEKTRKERETTTTTTTEETTEATPTPEPTPTPTPAPTETPTPTPIPTPEPNPYENEYVTDLCADYEDLAGSGYTYHVPHITIDSEDTNAINNEIIEFMQRRIADNEEAGVYSPAVSSRYSMFITDNGLMTIVFRVCGACDDDAYHMWTIDVNTGARLSNSEIAAAAGVTDIRAAALTAASEFCNHRYDYDNGPDNTPRFIDGELNPDLPAFDLLSEPEYPLYDEMQATFSEERLNADMCIGLDSDSNLIFVSEVFSEGGASSYIECYASDGQPIVP